MSQDYQSNIFDRQKTLSTGDPHQAPTHPTIHDSIMIHVNQTDPYIDAGIGDLTPNYWNGAPSSEAKVDYQVAYFHFPQVFIPQTGSGIFQLAITMEFTEGTDTEYAGALTPYAFTECPVIKLQFAQDGYQNAAEAAACIHQQILVANAITRHRINTFYTDFPNEPLSAHQAIELAFCDHFNAFIYDSAMCKYVFVLKPVSERYSFLYDSSLYDLNVRTIDVAFRTQAITAPSKTMASFLAMDTDSVQTYQYDGTEYTGYVGAFRSSGILPDIEMLTTQTQANGGIIFNNVPSINMILPSLLIPIIFPTQYVFIRTNAQSQTWVIDSKPKKSDILTVLPRVQNYGDAPYFNNMFFPSTTFSITTSLGGIKQLRLSLTDVNGNLLQFDKPFQMGILITPCVHSADVSLKQW